MLNPLSNRFAVTVAAVLIAVSGTCTEVVSFRNRYRHFAEGSGFEDWRSRYLVATAGCLLRTAVQYRPEITKVNLVESLNETLYEISS